MRERSQRFGFATFAGFVVGAAAGTVLILAVQVFALAGGPETCDGILAMFAQ